MATDFRPPAGHVFRVERAGATFADAAAEYLRYVEHDRGRKPSKLRGYRSAITAHLLPAFGSMPVEDVTAEEIERWLAAFGGSARTRNKLLIQLHGILGRAKKVTPASRRLHSYYEPVRPGRPVSPLAFSRSVQEPQTGLTPPLRRTPPGQQVGHPPRSSQGLGDPRCCRLSVYILVA